MININIHITLERPLCFHFILVIVFFSKLPHGREQH